MCMAVLLLAQGALSLYALRGFEDELAPQLHRKAEVVGRSVAAQIEEAVQLGIPFDQLVGMDAFLGDIIADNGDILYLAVLDQRGRVLYARDLPKDIADTLACRRPTMAVPTEARNGSSMPRPSTPVSRWSGAAGSWAACMSASTRRSCGASSTTSSRTC